ncbi:uncharacterized protein LAESUDRAFT_722295 [Laetiporus sulphureus 93-53]|uniref:Uncharacterized protein n=1 Tax=Laetiporus sulphureus 93-53 TaxID=1314785 RepID=A0A165GBV2_9APHY|nr:uncharacterized protein LAESUDRAFT_722295 [Laetiporus sulphureus 93-53]KZT10128.1 hypothetical protein LAESUDRAFT_722295 [Laetiporus sulphureus 93-53]
MSLCGEARENNRLRGIAVTGGLREADWRTSGHREGKWEDADERSCRIEHKQCAV